MQSPGEVAYIKSYIGQMYLNGLQNLVNGIGTITTQLQIKLVPIVHGKYGFWLFRGEMESVLSFPSPDINPVKYILIFFYH